MRRMLVALVVVIATGLVMAGGAAEASHLKDNPKKHRVFYHLNEGGADKANAVLTNIQNHVEVVGWENIEAMELVIHGPALKSFVAGSIDPGVRGKLDTLLAGGLRVDGCGLVVVPSGVARVMELQELGYAYIKP